MVWGLGSLAVVASVAEFVSVERHAGPPEPSTNVVDSSLGAKMTDDLMSFLQDSSLNSFFA